MQGKYFRSVCYSSDGDFVLAAGMSKYVCIYDVKSRVIVRKYPLTQNLSLEVPVYWEFHCRVYWIN